MQRSSVDIRKTSTINVVDPRRSSRTSITEGQQQPTAPSSDRIKQSTATMGPAPRKAQAQQDHRLPVTGNHDVKEWSARHAIQLANRAENKVRRAAKPAALVGGKVGSVMADLTLGRTAHDDREAELMGKAGFAAGGALAGGPVYGVGKTLVRLTGLPTAAWLGQRWLTKHGKAPEPASYGSVSTIEHAQESIARYY